MKSILFNAVWFILQKIAIRQQRCPRSQRSCIFQKWYMEFQNNTRCSTTYCVWTYRWRWYSKLWRRRKWHSKWKFSDPESLRRKSSSICGLYLLKRLSTTVAVNNHWSTYWPSAFSNKGMYYMLLIVHYITPT